MFERFERNVMPRPMLWYRTSHCTEERLGSENGNTMGKQIAISLLGIEQLLGIAMKTIIDALLESCKN